MADKPIPMAAPAFQAVKLEQVKRHLQVPLEDGEVDADLSEKLNQAIATFESDTGIAGAQRDFQWAPESMRARNPMPHYNPTAVQSVQYIDDAGDPVTLDPADYVLDLFRVHPELVLVGDLPSVSTVVTQPWLITYTAGAATFEAVLPEYTQAVLDMVRTSWEGHNGPFEIGPIYDAIHKRQYATYL